MIESVTIDRDAVNKRDAFSRIKNAMVEEKLIEERFGFVWPSQQPGGMFSNIPSPSISPLNFTTPSNASVVVAAAAVCRIYRPLRRFATSSSTACRRELKRDHLPRLAD
jgi:hypothetical protein